MTRVFAVLIALMAPSAAVSEGWALAEDDMSFQRVTERDDFVSLMSQGTLNRMGMTLNVEPDGDITGKAFGRKTGLIGKDLLNSQSFKSAEPYYKETPVTLYTSSKGIPGTTAATGRNPHARNATFSCPTDQYAGATMKDL